MLAGTFRKALSLLLQPRRRQLKWIDAWWEIWPRSKQIQPKRIDIQMDATHCAACLSLWFSQLGMLGGGAVTLQQSSLARATLQQITAPSARALIEFSIVCHIVYKHRRCRWYRGATEMHWYNNRNSAVHITDRMLQQCVSVPVCRRDSPCFNLLRFIKMLGDVASLWLPHVAFPSLHLTSIITVWKWKTLNSEYPVVYNTRERRGEEAIRQVRCWTEFCFPCRSPDELNC